MYKVIIYNAFGVVCELVSDNKDIIFANINMGQSALFIDVSDSASNYSVVNGQLQKKGLLCLL